MHNDLFDTATLRHRLLNGSQLREEHVWCLAKQAFPALCSDKTVAAVRFQSFLRANALLDAMVLAISTLSPPICLDHMRRTGSDWFCSASTDVEGHAAKATGKHRDMAAAMFIALLDIFERRNGGQSKRKTRLIANEDKDE
ncbi:hypothetical protein [Rhizobium sp. RM]|jgi:hypothetical protein|uniref:hypothetical protein n=1 Tax=Rhizobium/Agrobacterium group TaxID=227290 RepID=UPI00110E7DA6|nr:MULTISPECIES: hypothetical protein [Rhizobium/Agrobacterium group]NWJ27092.1 hypothetical protein [Rhizobium sp. RM]TMV22946.1 hypothetical protein BJG94_03000 [Rhizobium sp. Td3]UXS02416.1 hypothetical protein FY156_13550 [Agrobacterium tumefaciens]